MYTALLSNKEYTVHIHCDVYCTLCTVLCYMYFAHNVQCDVKCTLCTVLCCIVFTMYIVQMM